jgi:hypothetical protein
MCRIRAVKVCAFVALFSFASLLQAEDVGLVNLVAGEVTFTAKGATAEKVKPFMKVRDGDRFQVAKGAQLRVVYFAGARQERWSGPASFRAARDASKPISGSPAEVVALPAGVPQRIARVPELVQNAQLGGVQLRSGKRAGPKGPRPQGEGALREARATYESLRAKLAADDITAELYLYAVLSEHGLRDEMRGLAQEMQRKQPDNEEVKWLAKEVR